MAEKRARNKVTVKSMDHEPRPPGPVPPSKPIRVKTRAAVAAASASPENSCHVVIRRILPIAGVVEEYDGVYETERVKRHGRGQYQISMMWPTGTVTVVQIVSE